MNELSRVWSLGDYRKQVKELNQSLSRSLPGILHSEKTGSVWRQTLPQFCRGFLVALPVALGAALGLDLLLVGIYFTSGWAQQQAVTRPG